MVQPKLLRAALAAEPWAVSGLLYGLEDVIDDEGRPLAERRAPSLVKQGVAIELRRCPYMDERHGKPMNVSALAQVSQHLEVVLQDVRAFRSSLPMDQHGWHAVLTTVIDQLAGPALHVLMTRGGEPLRAARAVGHKLAAGYFGVVREILAGEAQGRQQELTPQGLIACATQSRAFLGASEVCAGPPSLLLRVSEVLVHGGSAQHVAPLRVEFATLLSAQVAMGITWELFDAALEHRLLCVDLPREQLRAMTEIVRRKLEVRRGELAQACLPPTLAQAASALPMLLGEPLRALLESGGHIDPAQASVTALVQDLLALNEGTLLVLDEGLRAPLAQRLAGYLLCYRQVLAALFAWERRLRQILGYAADGEMTLNGVMLPPPRLLRWFEMLLGHWVTCRPALEPELVLHNQRRRVVAHGRAARGAER